MITYSLAKRFRAEIYLDKSILILQLGSLCLRAIPVANSQTRSVRFRSLFQNLNID